MSDEVSLDSVLSGEVQETVEVQEELTLEESQPEVEQDETPEAETNEEPTASKEEPEEEKAEKEEWTFAAVKDERRKRQELEKQIQELKAQQTPEKERPDVFDDQKAFADSLSTEFDQKLANAKLDMAREFMMDAHDDYESMEASFIEIAKDNPILLAEARKASNPAKFVYQQAKKHAEFKEMQDVDKMREKMRAELKAELQAELEGAKKAKSDKVADISPSLAKARASKGEPAEEVTLDSLMNR